MDAWRKVKSNSGSAGVDGKSVEDFEKNLKNNLYKIWNRMSSGTYFPPPVLTVSIPKKSGGVRNLGIPTVADRVAQMVAKIYFEPIHKNPYYANSFPEVSKDLSVTELVSQQVLTIPMYPNMSHEEKNYVVDSISEFFE